MTQTLIAFLLVAWAATYSFWRLMPNVWRRKLRQTVERHHAEGAFPYLTLDGSDR